MKDMFKVSFENVKTGASAHFFVNNIDSLLDQEYFNINFKDAKTNEEFTIKEGLLKQFVSNEM